MSRYRSASDGSLKVHIGAGVIMSLLILYFGVFSGGGKMIQVIYASSAFWVLTLFSLAIGVIVKLKNPQRFTWPEYLLYAEWCLCVMCGLYALAFTTTTDLVRTEVWNGKAVRAYYQEQHTDERTVTETDPKGNTRTRKEYYTHSAEYGVETTAGNYAGNGSIYRNFVNRWGGESRSFGFCASATGPFFVYTTTYGGGPDRLVPVAVEHNYCNFVTASDSIKKLQGLAGGEEYAKFIAPHPRTFDGPFGRTEVDRVVVTADAPVPTTWTQTADALLDREMVELGPSKQCNIVIYVAGTSDQKLAHALEESWKLGEKNDIVVVVGAPQFPKVDWAYVMAWTDVQEFKIELRNKVLDAGKTGIGDAAALVNLVCAQVRQAETSGGYKRKPMSDYDYLISEISLPWWASLMIVVFGAGAQAAAAALFIQNDIEA